MRIKIIFTTKKTINFDSKILDTVEHNTRTNFCANTNFEYLYNQNLNITKYITYYFE
jgi:hypothetical protein